jgi:hypothetical protein
VCFSHTGPEFTADALVPTLATFDAPEDDATMQTNNDERQNQHGRGILQARQKTLANARILSSYARTPRKEGKKCEARQNQQNKFKK